MKHLLVLLFITLSFNTMAQRYALNAHHLVMADETGVILNEEVDIDMVLDTDKSRIVIYSKETQVLDYKIVRRYVDKDNYSVTETTATDTKWEGIRLDILINSELGSILINITYPSFSYVYVCEML